MSTSHVIEVKIGILLVANAVVNSPILIYTHSTTTCPYPPYDLGVNDANYGYAITGRCLIGLYSTGSYYSPTEPSFIHFVTYNFLYNGNIIIGSNCSAANTYYTQQTYLTINCYGYIPCSDGCTACSSPSVCTQCLSNMTLTNSYCCPIGNYAPYFGLC